MNMSLSSLNSVASVAILVLVVSPYLCTGYVHEINSKNAEKFLQGKLFVVTFVDSPTCTRCRSLFPFFMAASQVFPHDPEIFFTRTHDKKLVESWGVTELPQLIYHREGISKHEILPVDVIVDDVIDAIARTLHGNFAGLTRTYCVHLDQSNYDEMVVTPKQSTLILIHDKKDREDVATFEKVAYAFRKDDAVLVATLDVSKQKALRDEKFKTRETPTIMWLHVEEKGNPKRFGGVRSVELLVQFINERTGLLRNHDGAMQREAGRVPEADRLIQENLQEILEGQKDELKKVKEELESLKERESDHHHDMLDYYVYIIDHLALGDSSDVFKEMIQAIDLKLFGHEDTQTKTQETLKRRKNILLHFQALEKEYSKDKERREREELEEKIKAAKKKSEERKKEEIDGEKGEMDHSHQHTEL